MHWCADETLALLSIIPFLGAAVRWAYLKYLKVTGKILKPCPHDHSACSASQNAQSR